MSANAISQTEWDLQVALEKCDWLDAYCAARLGNDPQGWFAKMREVNADLRRIAADLLQRQEQDRVERYEGHCPRS